MRDEFYEDDDTAEFAPLEAAPRRRRRHLGVILLSVAVAVVLVGCGVMATMLKGVSHNDTPAASSTRQALPTLGASTSAPESEAPVALETTSSAPPSKAPTPSKKPKVTLTQQAPAPKHSTPAGCQPSRGPSQLPKATVKGYLDNAAAKHFWGTATKEEYAAIVVPKRLLYAIAEQESGWQSDIKACDGGLGLMQIMPTTQTFVNNRFGTGWDRTKPSDNVMCGANYLAWLIAYYGDKIAVAHDADPNYDASKANLELLKPVISAYNWGTAGVEPGMAAFPNGQYIQNVLSLMDGSRAGNY